MNPLQRILIEKVGHDHGFENVLPCDEPYVALGSARHPAQVTVEASEDGFLAGIQAGAATLALDSDWTGAATSFACQPRQALG
ncbi:MAG: hypothetical protein ORN28_08770 [Rhodoferax sp.]|nr:hypothetical protein [Rhodoferax sp.]